MALLGASPASAAPLKGLASPATCGNFAAEIANLTNPDNPGAVYGIIQLSYSSCTRNVWAYLDSYGPACEPGIDYCGTGTVYRNSDGATSTCSLQSGQTTCNSGQLYDGGVTSYAYGSVDNGPLSGYGQTASY